MSWEDVVATLVVLGIAGLVLAFGVFGARWVGNALLARRERTVDELSERGLTYGSDLAIRFALILVWLGFALGSLSLLPGLVWIVDADPDASRAAIGLAVVGFGIVGIGILCSLPGQNVVLLEPHRLVKVGPRRETAIDLAAVTSVADARVWPMTVVRGQGQRIRLSRTTAGFDDLFDRLASAVAEGGGIVGGPADPASGERPPLDVADLRVPKRITRGVVIFSGALLVFLLGWPWVVEISGDHPSRDALIFSAIGLGMWLLVALLIQSESFPRGQPVELRASTETVVWRTMRGGWTERPSNELYAASVETTIIYVRGQPGHRYPLRLRFVDGTVVEIGDRRAAQMGSSTQAISTALRLKCLGTAARSMSDEAAATRALSDARALPEPLVEVEALRTAIARWPSPDNLSLHMRAGDLLRRSGRTDEAVGHYRAYLDFFPDDAIAWQALAECFRGGYRTELYDETITMAEQLLMKGG